MNQIGHNKIKNRMNRLTNTGKKMETYQIKIFKLLTVQEKYSHLPIVIADKHHRIPTIFVDHL